MDDLIQKLKSIKHKGVNPDKEWLEKNRVFLLSQVSNTVTESAGSKFNFSADKMWKFMSVFLPRKVVYGIVRPVAVIAMVFSLGTGGWIATVAASQNTIPGDALHSTKMLTEKVHIAVLSAIDAKDTETKKRGNYAKRRAQEIQKLASSHDVGKINRVPAAIKVLTAEVKKVEEDIKEIQESKEVSKKVTAGAVKEVGNDTKEIGDLLKDIEKELISSTSTAQEVRVDLIEAKKVSAETSMTAMEVMVGKHAEGDTTVTTDEVKEVIKTKVDSLSSETTDNKVVLDKATVEAQKVVSTSTAVIVNTSTEAAATEVGVAEKEIVDSVKETDSLLKVGDLKNALKVVVEAGKTAAKAQVTKDETMDDLQVVSPKVASIVLEDDTKTTTTTNTPKNSASTTTKESASIIKEKE